MVEDKTGIAHARSRLGAEPLKKLYESVVFPIAKRETKGVWYRQWPMVSLDGRTLDAAEELATLYHQRWEIETALDGEKRFIRRSSKNSSRNSVSRAATGSTRVA